MDSKLIGVGKASNSLADMVASMSQIDNQTLFNVIGSQIKKEPIIYGGGFWMDLPSISAYSSFRSPYSLFCSRSCSITRSSGL